jgi:hypothetical protein
MYRTLISRILVYQMGYKLIFLSPLSYIDSHNHNFQQIHISDLQNSAYKVLYARYRNILRN